MKPSLDGSVDFWALLGEFAVSGASPHLQRLVGKVREQLLRLLMCYWLMGIYKIII